MNKDTELERNVILEEYRDTLDDSSCILDELLHKHLFKGHNLSKSAIGIEKTINNIKASDIRKHHEKYYKLSEMGLVLVGNFPQEIHKHIKRLFSPKSKLYVPLVQTNFVFNCNVPNVIYKHKKDLNQTCISVVFSTVNFNESDKDILEFIGTYLGEGMSSRLFIELREKNSLVYTVEAEQCSYNTGGYFSIETQLKSKNIEKTISIIIKELELLKRGKISNEDNDLLDTALREAREETGIFIEREKIVGQLEPVTTLNSGFTILPFICILSKIEDLTPNSEVDEFLEIPLEPFLETLANDSDPKHNSIQEMYTFTFENHLIWGASARMLKQITTKLK